MKSTAKRSLRRTDRDYGTSTKKAGSCISIAAILFSYKGLRLIKCRMVDCDLAFEKSDAEADILSHVVSIKNPHSGIITVESVGELIMDDPEADGQVFESKDMRLRP